MEQLSMNDGLDGRETLAFGLAAGELAVFVLALMSAYAVLRSGLPGAIAWTVAPILVGGGALLAWGRLAGRPLVEWTVLLAGFMFRTRHARVDRLREGLRGWRTAGLSAATRMHARAKSAPVARSGQSGAVVIPLALRRPQQRIRREADPERPTRNVHNRVVAFFSLAGGTGRTTLAVEVAATLAVRGRVAQATRTTGPRVALLDLARRNPSVGLRLGMPAPPGGERTLTAHESGLLVGLAPAATLPADQAGSAAVMALLDSPACAAADVIIVDFDCDLDDDCTRLLRRCDQVLVTLTPTSSGVVDAYRSTAVLRRLGLRHRIGYVVNRWRPGADLAETMADLGGVIAAQVPDDAVLADSAHRHQPVAVDGEGAAVAALNRLATYVEDGAVRSARGVQSWGSTAG